MPNLTSITRYNHWYGTELTFGFDDGTFKQLMLDHNYTDALLAERAEETTGMSISDLNLLIMQGEIAGYGRWVLPKPAPVPTKLPAKRLHIGFSFKWFDLWVGAFIDTKQHAVYICPLPCCVFKLTFE